MLYHYGPFMEEKIDVDIIEAQQIVSSKGTKIVWLGSEPIEYISKLLDMDKEQFLFIDPNELFLNKDMMKLMEDHVFMCYHGNSSKFVVNHLKNSNIRSYNLKKGITSIVGEIF